MAGVSLRAIEMAAAVRAHAQPDTIEAVKNGKMTLNAAYEIAKPKEETGLSEPYRRESEPPKTVWARRSEPEREVHVGTETNLTATTERTVPEREPEPKVVPFAKPSVTAPVKIEDTALDSNEFAFVSQEHSMDVIAFHWSKLTAENRRSLKASWGWQRDEDEPSPDDTFAERRY
jgi:hypothetical protein